MGDWVGRLIGGAVIGGGVGFVIGAFVWPETGPGWGLIVGVIVGGWFGFLMTPTDGRR
jgi:hypothetical protein